MIPSRAIIAGFALALMAGRAINCLSLFSSAASPNTHDGAASTGASGYSDGPSPDNGQRPGRLDFETHTGPERGATRQEVMPASASLERKTGADTARLQPGANTRDGAAARTDVREVREQAHTKFRDWAQSKTAQAEDLEAHPVCSRYSSPARPILLDALRSAESLGSDVSKPNAKGALGPYQFLRRTWDDHANGIPWSEAVDEPTARIVADRYLTWLDRTITAWSGQPATLDQILAAWNGGIGTLRSVGFDPSRMTTEEAREFPGRVRSAMEGER